MRLQKTFLLLAILSCAPGIALAADPESNVFLTETTKAGSPGKSFVANTAIAAPLKDLCGIIQNYADYPSFMPNTASTVVSSSGPSHSVIDVTLKLPMGKIKKYRLRMEPKSSAQSCVIAWKMLPWPGLKQDETIADTIGSWQLTPSSVPGKTMVKYTVYTDPGPIPFGLGWIVDSLSKDSIPQTLDALARRATKGH